MPYQVIQPGSVVQSIRRFDRAVQRRLVNKLESLEVNPRPPGHIKLAGHDLYRIRVGDYRILYAINDTTQTVEIALVAHRRESYRGL